MCRGNCPEGPTPERPLSTNAGLPVVPPSLFVPESERERGRALRDGHGHCSFFPFTVATDNFQSPGGTKQGPVLAPDWVVLYEYLCSLLSQGCVSKAECVTPGPEVISPADKQHHAPRSPISSVGVRISCGC